MAIIGTLFAMLGRVAGRVVNALLGWATLLLFGRVEARKQTILGFMALGFLAWLAALAGFILPDIGTFLIAAVPRPDFVDEGLVRLGMLTYIVVAPLAIGAAGVWAVDAHSRPSGLALVRAVLRGYPFTAALAVMIMVLGIVAGTRKIRSLAKRWTDAHVPLVIKPGEYDRLVAELVEVFRRSDIAMSGRRAPRALLLPARILDRVAGRTLGGIVPDRLMLLTAPGLEILVYPTDIAISGEPGIVARSRAAIARHLTRAPAWLTVSAEGQEIEDRLEAVAAVPEPGVRGAALARIDHELEQVVLPYEEWETLYRMRLQVALSPALSEPRADVPSPPVVVPVISSSRFERITGIGYGVTVLALLALDVALMLLGRTPSSHRRA